jgi:hypothetical protein
MDRASGSQGSMNYEFPGGIQIFLESRVEISMTTRFDLIWMIWEAIIVLDWGKQWYKLPSVKTKPVLLAARSYEW